MTSSTTAPLLDEADLRWVVEQAARAPSINNTQPWRFGWDGSTIEVRADLRRGLVVSDPEGRELIMSCGAALYNLRLALRLIGRSSTTTVFPDPHDAHVLARMLVELGPPVAEAERQLFEALRRRHTHRGSFSDPQLHPDLAVRLQEAAGSQGAQLVFVHEPGPKQQVLHLARAAERARSSHEGARTETTDWTPSLHTARRDGVPAQAYSAGPPAAGPDELAARDFDLGRDVGAGERAAQPSGGVAVLVTDGDLAQDWLRAGQALEAVLLAAAAEWTFAILHSRVTEVAPLRAELRRAIGTAGYPQLLFRFGYAGIAPTTPRRPAAEVIDRTE